MAAWTHLRVLSCDSSVPFVHRIDASVHQDREHACLCLGILRQRGQLSLQAFKGGSARQRQDLRHPPNMQGGMQRCCAAPSKTWRHCHCASNALMPRLDSRGAWHAAVRVNELGTASAQGPSTCLSV